MPNYDKRYEIRLAEEKDIPGIMQFIDEYWHPGHLLAKNREFFEYEFLEEDGTVNFVLAIDREKNSIEALTGFLRPSRKKACDMVWGSFWKVKEGNMLMLGTEVIRRVFALANCKFHIGVGQNPNTAVPIMKRIFQYKIGKMSHYYQLARRVDYKIARVSYLPQSKAEMDSSFSVIKYDSIEQLSKDYDLEQNRVQIPYKDAYYINKRYFKHPIYQYQVLGICGREGVKALAVFREQEYKGRIAVRWVDYIGWQEYMKGLERYIEQLFEDSRYEYVDFYGYGFSDACLRDAGFTEWKEGDPNVIPNYFAPFEQKNIDIWIHTPIDNVLICKADGDQDRPNAE